MIILHISIIAGQLAVAKFTSILNKKKELLALLEEKKANLEGTAEINGVISAHLKQHLVAETKVLILKLNVLMCNMLCTLLIDSHSMC